MMDFLSTNTSVLSKKYQLLGFTLFLYHELFNDLYYFKDRGNFF